MSTTGIFLVVLIVLAVGGAVISSVSNSKKKGAKELEVKSSDQ